MPLYVYRCKGQHQFERVLPLSRYDEPQSCPDCGEPAQKVIVAPAVLGDYPAYVCPVTGNVIEGRRAHQENLARHGCRVLEPGERETAARARKAHEEQLENSIAETAAEFVAGLGADKQEKLGNELSHGLDVSFERGTAVF